MSLASSVIDALVAAGCTAEQLAAAMKAANADAETRVLEKRAKDAERQRKSRISRGLSRDVTVTDCDNTDVTESTPFPSPPNENNLTPPTHTPETITRARKETPLPSDWEPVLSANSQRIIDGWPPGMFDRQVAQFRDYAADKGRKSRDWQAAFRTWITKADDWKPNGTGRTQQRSTADLGRDVAAQLEREAAAGRSGGAAHAMLGASPPGGFQR